MCRLSLHLQIRIRAQHNYYYYFNMNTSCPGGAPVCVGHISLDIPGYSKVYKIYCGAIFTQRIEISPLLGEIAEALLGVHDENSL